MSILVDSATRLVVQGMTGRQGTYHTERALAHQTNVVAGVTPGKGGTQHLGLPVFDSMAEAVDATGANATVIFVPPDRAAAAMIEAIDSNIDLIVCITERIPLLDMVRVKAHLRGSQSRLLGPNCIGIISPGQCRAGILPTDVARAGKVGIISRCGTLTYEAIGQTTANGLGQSTCVGIGADLIRGLDFVDCLELFRHDPQTEGIILLGEVGGSAEEEAARFLKKQRYPKPVVAYIAGQFAPPGRRMGHAGAIVMSGTGTARAKINRLRAAGVHIVESPVVIGATMANVLGHRQPPADH